VDPTGNLLALLIVRFWRVLLLFAVLALILEHPQLLWGAVALVAGIVLVVVIRDR